jgi:hypothetical protein
MMPPGPNLDVLELLRHERYEGVAHLEREIPDPRPHRWDPTRKHEGIPGPAIGVQEQPPSQRLPGPRGIAAHEMSDARPKLGSTGKAIPEGLPALRVVAHCQAGDAAIERVTIGRDRHLTLLRQAVLGLVRLAELEIAAPPPSSSSSGPASAVLDSASSWTAGWPGFARPPV